MHRVSRNLAVLALAALICGSSAVAFAQGAVTPAKANGPIPSDKDNYAFLSSNRVQTLVDLQKVGYVEEEFIVSGNANVYKWNADGSLAIQTPNAPYATRILIRRPANAAKFSGTVVFEPMENTRSFDWSFLWATSHEYFTEHGDAWVGITHNPQAVDALKKFNPKRYGQLSMANPTPNEACGPTQTKSDNEVGLKFDIFSQVAAALKSPTGPMAGFKVEKVYGTSHTGEIVAYAHAIQPVAKVFDGFLFKGESGPTAISRCDSVPNGNDTRRLTKNVGVPVIRVVSEGDVTAGFPLRRPDSDEMNDRFRWYEVAAAPHMDIRYYQFMPAIDDQSKTGQAAFSWNWPFAYNCERNNEGLLDLPVFQVTLNASFYHLDQWVRKGTPPPRAQVMTVKDGGTPQASIATDQNGNGIGGVRSPYVDVPVATYVTHTPGQAVCRNLGYKVPFEWSRLEALYGSSKNYATKVNQKIDQLVKDGWLLPSDAKRVRADLLPPPPGARTSSNN
jgi:hypothetical protein